MQIGTKLADFYKLKILHIHLLIILIRVRGRLRLPPPLSGRQFLVAGGRAVLPRAALLEALPLVILLDRLGPVRLQRLELLPDHLLLSARRPLVMTSSTAATSAGALFGTLGGELDLAVVVAAIFVEDFSLASAKEDDIVGASWGNNLAVSYLT